MVFGRSYEVTHGFWKKLWNTETHIF